MGKRVKIQTEWDYLERQQTKKKHKKKSQSIMDAFLNSSMSSERMHELYDEKLIIYGDIV